MTVDAPQLGRFVSSMRDAADELRDLTAPSLAAAQLARVQAERLAPRLTGKLAASHTVKADHSTGTVANSQPYAVPVERRTRYLAKAWGASFTRAEEAFSDHIDSIIGRVEP